MCINGAYQSSYGYAGNTGKLSQLALPNGATTNYGYDALDRLTQIQSLTNTNANISRYAYAYDNVAHRAGRTQEVSQVEGDDPITRAYGYDDVDQVTSEVLSQAGVTLQSTSYGLDPMGNRTQMQSTSQAGQSTSSYLHNRLNQTTSLSTTNAQGTSQNTLSYDDEGNLTHVGATAQNGTFYTYDYTYDDANQLSQIVNRDAAGEPQSKSTFLYNGLKRLLVSRDFSWQNGAWVQTSEVRRVYDGMDVVQERDATNSVICTYTRDGNIGGLLSRSDGNGHLFYHYDGRGNVTQLTDASAQVTARYSYDAFGNTSASGTASSVNRYRYSTKEQMASGLYSYGYRFYSPGLGRWINRDPIEEEGGINLYQAFAGDPINGLDEYGENAGQIAVGIGAGAGAVGTGIAAGVTAPVWVPIAICVAAGVALGTVIYNATDSSKNEPHINQKAKEAAEEALRIAREALEAMKRTPNKTKEIKEEIERLQRQVNRLRERAERAGETHSRRGKGR